MTRLETLIFALIALFLAGITTVNAQDDNRISLKLFGKDVVETYDGCSFALWQDDKVPEKDKYAYVFYAPIHDAAELPGWVKIGTKVHEFARQDVSDAGPDLLAPYQLYKSGDDKSWMIMEIKKQYQDGNDLIVELAELTFVQPKKHPFTSVVKGKYGCPQSAYDAVEQTAEYSSLDGDPISLKLTNEFSEIGAIPKPIRKYIYSNYESCDLEMTAGYSAQYAISDQMSLWMVPCALYASSATSNFFIALNDNPEHFTAVYANHPANLNGFENGDLKEMLNASVVEETGSIIAMEDSSSGCGSYWKYQLRAVEGEAVEAFLAEYRTKQDCDGNQVEPKNLPIVYMAD